MITQQYINDLSCQIVGGAIEVHNQLGPGLLESVYQNCLIKELNLKGLEVKQQIRVPINYKRTNLECDLRLDILVEYLIIVELKAVDAMFHYFKLNY